MKNSVITIRVMSDGDRTVAEAAVPAGLAYGASATGSSSREPGDKASPQIGEALAVARALRKLAGRLEKQAQGAMKHRESVRAHRAEIEAAIAPHGTAGSEIWAALGVDTRADRL